MSDEAKTLVIGTSPSTGDPVLDATLYLAAVSCFGKQLGAIDLDALEKLHERIKKMRSASLTEQIRAGAARILAQQESSKGQP